MPPVEIGASEGVRSFQKSTESSVSVPRAQQTLTLWERFLQWIKRIWKCLFQRSGEVVLANNRSSADLCPKPEQLPRDVLSVKDSLSQGSRNDVPVLTAEDKELLEKIVNERKPFCQGGVSRDDAFNSQKQIVAPVMFSSMYDAFSISPEADFVEISDSDDERKPSELAVVQRIAENILSAASAAVIEAKQFHQIDESTIRLLVKELVDKTRSRPTEIWKVPGMLTDLIKHINGNEFSNRERTMVSEESRNIVRSLRQIIDLFRLQNEYPFPEELENLLRYSQLVKATYMGKERIKKENPELLPEDWHYVEKKEYPDNLQKFYNDTTGLVTMDDFGLKFALYKNSGAGAWVLAFAGTEGGLNGRASSNWQTNLAQAAGFCTSPYIKAVEVVKAIFDKVNNENFVLCGHSLGGGLASNAAVQLARSKREEGARDRIIKTICFNSAAIGVGNQLQNYWSEDWQSDFSPTHISHYRMETEILGRINAVAAWWGNSAYGRAQAIPPVASPAASSFYLHKMDAVMENLRGLRDLAIQLRYLNREQKPREVSAVEEQLQEVREEFLL